MMKRDEATQNQVNAANPNSSTWLSANAGSGKTRVLTDRVARLLLNGVDPQNILCLTYTKAAAAEMQNRLFRRLGAWAMMGDDDLRADLLQLGDERAITAVELSKARQLFATAIETPGGLKIQTIHSFCSGVLRRFPLEAQISPQFQEMEDRTAELLRTDVLDVLVSGPDRSVVDGVLRYFTGTALTDLARDVISKREALEQPLDDVKLRDSLDLAASLTDEMLVDAVFADGVEELLISWRDILAKGSSTEEGAAKKLAALRLGGHRDLADIALLETVLLTGSGAKAPFSAKIGTFPTKGTREKHPDLTEELNDLMATVEAARQDRLALIAYRRTVALYAFAQKMIPAYEAAKQARGLLDFDDLIRKTKQLLTDPKLAQWVLFRLDGGIDHVLVDEAQDTSPSQWDVVRLLTQEFTAGEGANVDKERTIFVVGDQKQSIYSFQGAVPEAFDEMRHHFETALSQVDAPFSSRQLAHSFRSSSAVLHTVDQVFGNGDRMGASDPVDHIAFKDQMPGRVDIWPVIEKVDEPEPGEWFKPIDAPGQKNHIVQMAKRVADQIKHMIAHETLPEEIEHTGEYNHRPISEGDFLILVRGRKSGLFEEIIRACKNAELEVAGADRLRVGAELAVRDITALLSFLALPEDDLSLACALRSPLFGWSEQMLFSLAHHREDKAFLWQALRASAHADTLDVLQDLRKQADFLRPYDLIERVLTRFGGRQALLARLGLEAEDGIDALLSQALNYESMGVPSLTGFLTWMETDTLEIKRQMDSQGDRIRVMTVHGAKGLEAPIVILPDTAKRKNDVRADLIAADQHFIWKPSAAESSDTLLAMQAGLADAQAMENQRLLYVAMTRAEKWLIVGAAGEIGEPDQSWYAQITAELPNLSVDDVTCGELGSQRISNGDWQSGELLDPKDPPLPPVSPQNYGKAQPLIIEKTLAPSDLGGAKALAGDFTDMDEDAAMARGTAIHLLLEHLPMVPTGERKAKAQALLLSQDAGHTDHDEIITHVMGLLDNPDLAPLWDPSHLREVELTATISGRRFHGTIDLLDQSDNRIRAIDFKSNRLVPDRAEDTPEGVLRQMAVYHAGLAQIFPDQVVNVAILWTQTGEIMDIPEKLIADALARVTAA